MFVSVCLCKIIHIEFLSECMRSTALSRIVVCAGDAKTERRNKKRFASTIHTAARELPCGVCMNMKTNLVVSRAFH